jgi:hypothetical protein
LNTACHGTPESLHGQGGRWLAHIDSVLLTIIIIFVQMSVVNSAGKGNQEHQGYPILGSGSLQFHIVSIKNCPSA